MNHENHIWRQYWPIDYKLKTTTDLKPKHKSIKSKLIMVSIKLLITNNLYS